MNTPSHHPFGKLLAFSVFAMIITGFTSCGDEDNNSLNNKSDGVVINGVTWATRNVDAPGTFAASTFSAGKFYQWNRNVGWSSSDPLVNSNGGTAWNATIPAGDTWAKENDPSPSGWRVPDTAEINRLLDTSRVETQWITLLGVNGLKFTDKQTGKSIFLPAAGYRSRGDGSLFYVGNDGYYWSSTGDGSDRAYGLGFVSGGAYLSYYYDRRSGFSVRPVAE